MTLSYEKTSNSLERSVMYTKLTKLPYNDVVFRKKAYPIISLWVIWIKLMVW